MINRLDAADRVPYTAPHFHMVATAQDTTNLLGCIIRIDVNNGDPYAIPPDNPFVGNTNAQQEIFAYGLRNAWRMSFDAGGQFGLIAADVGQNSWEEVNVITKGAITAGIGWRGRTVSTPTIRTNTRRNARIRATARSSSTQC